MSPIDRKDNFRTFVVLHQQLVNPHVNYRLIDSIFIANRANPSSKAFLMDNQSFQAQTRKMLAIVTSNWNSDFLFGIWTHQADFLFLNLEVARAEAVQKLNRVLLFHFIISNNFFNEVFFAQFIYRVNSDEIYSLDVNLVEILKDFCKLRNFKHDGVFAY
jgi:hypothetical protein